MSLVGPDGQPLGQARIIGAPLSFPDIEPYRQHDIDAFIEGAKGLMERGAPPEAPAAMPMGQIFQLARTLQFYTQRVDALERQIVELEEPGGDTPSGLPSRVDLSSLPSGAHRGDLTGGAE